MTSFFRLLLAGFFFSFFTLMFATPASEAKDSSESGDVANLSDYMNAGPDMNAPDGDWYPPLPKGWTWVWYRSRCVRPEPPRIAPVMIPPPKIYWIKNLKVVMKYKDCSPIGRSLRKHNKEWKKYRWRRYGGKKKEKKDYLQLWEERRRARRRRGKIDVVKEDIPAILPMRYSRN